MLRALAKNLTQGLRVQRAQGSRVQGVRRLAYHAEGTKPAEPKAEPSAAETEEAAAKKKKARSHAFFVSWYLLIAVGSIKWYMNKHKEAKEPAATA
mmetsp:Transcript_26830/g.41945  ORF Transcript_26830/g.41945 Transcript_26830/m.41945 type:complete len:96 (+) Transcript_26830:85-372(+)|eukprot:CAMPEP_0184317702 /NCGR_PEP_ID=MMETSP1049-20130417/98213_1 /TAXON_ID=77928 /ORGANISM="Proteomonas sulcata, Strain CCMP704" /LENGTH=95 /DNA_ID=CAMNT_0026637193 /DNA_START=60 /DNA_END=347 /DNA_ORIENTATION=-